MIRVMFDVGIIFRGLMQKDHFFGYLFWINFYLFYGYFLDIFRSSVVKIVLFNTHFSH